MLDAMQRAAFEAWEPFGPEVSAVLSGFAIYWHGVLHITPAGERYLATTEEELTL